MASKTATLSGPSIKTKLPGPNAQRVLAGDERWISPSYTRSYPLVAQARPRRGGRGRGRQRVPRLLRRHRRGLHRTLPSRGGRRHPEAGGRADPHVGHRLLLREHDHAGRAALARSRPCPARTGLLRQLRRGGDRSRAQAGALPHPAPAHHRLLRRLPRTHHGRAVADRRPSRSSAAASRR